MIAAIYARKSNDQKRPRRRGEERHPAGGPRDRLRHAQGLDGRRGPRLHRRRHLRRHLRREAAGPLSPPERLETAPPVPGAGRDGPEPARARAGRGARGPAPAHRRPASAIFCYLTDTEIKRGTAVEKFQANAIAFVDEMAREQGRQRTRDAMVRKARQGHVAGGMVYGYRNVRHADHVERVIDPTEAAIIRRIFEACASRPGLRPHRQGAERGGRSGATRALVGADRDPRDAAPRPVPRAGRLRQDDVGVSRRRAGEGRRPAVGVDHGGRPGPADRLRGRCGRRRRRAWTRPGAAYIRRHGGKLWGRPETGLESRYLLTGLAACGVCGASLHVRLRRPGTAAPTTGAATTTRGARPCARTRRRCRWRTPTRPSSRRSGATC